MSKDNKYLILNVSKYIIDKYFNWDEHAYLNMLKNIWIKNYQNYLNKQLWLEKKVSRNWVVFTRKIENENYNLTISIIDSFNSIWYSVKWWVKIMWIKFNIILMDKIDLLSKKTPETIVYNINSNLNFDTFIKKYFESIWYSANQKIIDSYKKMYNLKDTWLIKLYFYSKYERENSKLISYINLNNIHIDLFNLVDFKINLNCKNWLILDIFK